MWIRKSSEIQDSAQVLNKNEKKNKNVGTYQYYDRYAVLRCVGTEKNRINEAGYI